jgi:hypothetical protein
VSRKIGTQREVVGTSELAPKITSLVLPAVLFFAAFMLLALLVLKKSRD